MARDSPLALVGEFDAINGAKMTYAFECFDYSCDSSLVSSHGPTYSATRHLQYLSGQVFLGRRVASGCQIHRSYVVYCNGVAQRVLNSNETREESLIFCDSNGTTVGSFAFTLPDILARGEKRRFCLAFIHPIQDEMVRRWPQLSLLAHMLISRWYAQLDERYTFEYETFCNLDRMRESAHKRPLRSLMTLLAQNGETEMEALRGVHCFLDCALPMLFLRQGITTYDDEEESILRNKIQCQIDAQLPLAEAGTDWVELTSRWATIVVQPHAHRTFLPHTRIVVKPLAVWLAELFAAASDMSRHRRPACEAGDDPVGALSSAREAIHVLLYALFSGDLIVVSGDAAATCASLVLALSYALPRSLAHFAIFAKDYPATHGARIVSFDDDFLSTHEVQSRDDEGDVQSHRRSSSGGGGGDDTLFRPPVSSSMEVSMSDSQAGDNEDDCRSGSRRRGCGTGEKGVSGEEKRKLILSQLRYDGIVHVVVRQDRIVDVRDCRVPPPPPPRRDTTRTTTTAPAAKDKRTTLVNRIIALLESSMESEGGGCVSVPTYKLLTAQLRQLVCEYVVRGTVYNSLFKDQEVRMNKAMLERCDAGNGNPHRYNASHSGAESSSALPRFFSGSSLKRSMRRMLGMSPNAVAHETLDTTGSTRDAGGGAAQLRKHESLQEIAGRAFARERYAFSSSAAEDHSILTFLGCATE